MRHPNLVIFPIVGRGRPAADRAESQPSTMCAYLTSAGSSPLTHASKTFVGEHIVGPKRSGEEGATCQALIEAKSILSPISATLLMNVRARKPCSEQNLKGGPATDRSPMRLSQRSEHSKPVQSR